MTLSLTPTEAYVLVLLLGSSGLAWGAGWLAAWLDREQERAGASSGWEAS